MTVLLSNHVFSGFLLWETAAATAVSCKMLRTQLKLEITQNVFDNPVKKDYKLI